MAETPRPTYDELAAENERLRSEVERLKRDVEKLKQLVEEIRRAGKRQAAPFSERPPKPAPRTPGRKSGEDHGFHAHRAIPPRIDETYDAVLPECCPCCGLAGEIVFERTAAQYQTEIPRVEPIYRKFNVAVGHCSRCHRRVQGRHKLQTSDALGAAASQMGSNAQSLATTLNKEYGLSHGKVIGVLSAFCHTTLTRGASAQIMMRTAQRCVQAYRDIQIVVRQSAWCVPDETGWRVGGRLRWLHVFVTELGTLYLIRPSRGFDVAAEALGADYDGDLTHDGWAPYDRFVNACHGQCNQHLLRRCDHILETATRGAVNFPRQVKALLQEGFAVRDKRDAGDISLAQATAKAKHLTERLAGICGPKTCADNQRFASFLNFHIGEVFNYLRRPNLDATNWRAEQSIRPAVVNRKVWGGNRTDPGAHAQEILMSILRTLHQHGRDALTFLSATMRAPPGGAPRLSFSTPSRTARDGSGR